jgi:hypothetical protein
VCWRCLLRICSKNYRVTFPPPPACHGTPVLSARANRVRHIYWDYFQRLVLKYPPRCKCQLKLVEEMYQLFAKSSSESMFWINLPADVEFLGVVKMLKERLG